MDGDCRHTDPCVSEENGTPCPGGMCMDGSCQFVCSRENCGPEFPCRVFSECQDGLFCVFDPQEGQPCPGGFCRDGSCAPDRCLGVTCPADGCREQGVCDPATGWCSHSAKPDGIVCDDHNACTRDDRCMSGGCFGMDPVVCEQPADPCAPRVTCDPATGVCPSAAPVDGGPANADAGSANPDAATDAGSPVTDGGAAPDSGAPAGGGGSVDSGSAGDAGVAGAAGSSAPGMSSGSGGAGGPGGASGAGTAADAGEADASSEPMDAGPRPKPRVTSCSAAATPSGHAGLIGALLVLRAGRRRARNAA